MTRSTLHILTLILILAALPLFGATEAPLGQPIVPTFTKAFAPDTIGPGSSSILVFTIVNPTIDPVIDLAFTDVLPAGLTLASPANTVSTCGGTLTAPDGGGTISLSGGNVAGSSACAITVTTTSSTPGVHMNVSGDLTSSAGNSGTASDDLTVATDRPGFSKSFAPTSIGFGSRSTLTFTIDNSANMSFALNAAFTDILPPGLVIAGPALASTTCPGSTVTAVSGSNVVSLGGFSSNLPAGATCEVAVDVTGAAVGTLVNISGDLTSTAGGPVISSGVATDEIEVTATTVYAVKSFTDDPVVPGDTVTLEFTIANGDRVSAATSIALTDDLNATLAGLVAVGLPMSDVCGAGSQISGTGLLSLTGGNLAPESSCTFSVTLQVPATATTGVYPNTTSALTATLGGAPFTGNQASDSLVVNNAPLLTKTFLTDPVGAGGTASMEFTITNTSTTSPATDIAFEDNLGAFLSGSTVSSLPPSGFCGAGATAFTTTIGGDLHLAIVGANLAAGGSCTFQVDLLLPVGGSAGDYTNTTTPIGATVDGLPQLGNPASDTLTVVTAPNLTKAFTDDPVGPGATVTLEFTILHDPTAPADATAIAFSDDLNAVIPGLAATGLPMSDVCGAGSLLSGTTSLTLTGGTLAPGSLCTFSVPLLMPAAALPGVYTNTTSGVTATVAGAATAGNPGQDTLQITGLAWSKSFIDDPVIPGNTVTLEFTIDNTSAASDATGMLFTDNLGATLTGLVATGLPMNDICGTGSSISGTNLLIFTGGNLLAGTSCTISIVLDVPAGAVSNTYFNSTSNLSATMDGSPVVLPPASDQLVVDDRLLQLTKEFTDDPVAPGDTVTLEFTVTNLDPAQTATAIDFTDDLDAALSGLSAVGLPANDVCGMGSQISGSGLLTFAGGTLGPGASCTFSVTLQVPAGVSMGTVATNTTSRATGTLGGLAVTGSPATDNLFINFVDFSKSFDSPVGAGGTAVLSFVIDNLDGANSVGGLSFTDDLDAVVAGLVATGLPLNDVCGAGSQISGTSFLTLAGATLLPSGSCTINVSVLVPPTAAAGTYPNITSDIFASGLPVGTPATADLTVEPPPVFAKSFTPALIQTGGISSMTFTIDNSAAAVAATGLDFTDNLPAGMVIATPPNSTLTCTGGTLTATAGSGSVGYTGGTVAAGSTCTATVDVFGLAAGALVNTSGDLTSSLGNSGPATATLTVEPRPLFSKSFAPTLIQTGGLSNLSFAVDNTAATLAVTGLDFTDILPTGVVVATPPNAATTCGGGTLTAVAGSIVVAYTGGAVTGSESCTISVDVTGVTAGTWVNTTGDLTSSAGNSGPATATIDVVEGDFVLSKTFLSAPVLRGGLVELEFTLTNVSPVSALSQIAFTDDLDAVVPDLAATGLPVSDVCGAGSLLSGTSVVSLTGGSLAPMATCTFTATVVVPADAPLGIFTNTTSPVTADAGGIPVSASAASADVEIGFFAFDKVFLNSATPGSTVELEFSITNPDPANPATGIGFTDDLDAVLPGSTAVGLPTPDVCGAGSLLDGSSILTLSGGSLAPGVTCVFSATVMIPSGSLPGSYPNTTSVLAATVAGTTVVGDTGSVASDDLQVNAAADAIPVLDPRGILVLTVLMALIGVWALRIRR